MKILVLEDDISRANYFIEKFGGHDLIITENANDAIEHLDKEVFDLIFIDNDLGISNDNGSGADAVAFLYENSDNENNDATIVLHTWNTPAAKAMLDLLPQAYFFPYNSDEFLSIEC